MLTSYLPIILALLGTALMAIVIFAPAPASAPATVTMSLAPPAAPPRASGPGNDASAFVPQARDRSPVHVAADDASALGLRHEVAAFDLADDAASAPIAPFWPALVDARASGCDAASRARLAEALGAVRAEWADDVLSAALDEETDLAVRAALVRAMSRPV